MPSRLLSLRNLLILVGVLIAAFVLVAYGSTRSQLGNDCLKFLQDVTIEDGSVVPSGTTQKTWHVKNCGDTTWTNYRLVRLTYQGDQNKVAGTTPAQGSVPALKPGEEGDISIPLTLPPQTGDFRIDFAVSLPDGKHFFGEVLWVAGKGS